MTAFVLGNGISRQAVEPEILSRFGPVYGCNALYRTFKPAVLVATDAEIAREIQDTGYGREHEFYTRRPLPQSGAKTIPKPYFGFSSGPVALVLACHAMHDPIYLLGFDMGPTTQGRFNNIYAGTRHYKAIDAGPTFTGNWIRQIMRVMKEFQERRFVRVYGDTTAKIADLDGVKNLEHVTLADFLQCINTGKGL